MIDNAAMDRSSNSMEGSFNITANVPRGDAFNHLRADSDIGRYDEADSDLGRDLAGVGFRASIDGSINPTMIPRAIASLSPASCVGSGSGSVSASSNFSGIYGSVHLHPEEPHVQYGQSRNIYPCPMQPNPVTETYGSHTVNFSTMGEFQSAETQHPRRGPYQVAAAPSAQAGSPSSSESLFHPDPLQPPTEPASLDSEIVPKLKLIACCVSNCDKFILGLRALEKHIRDDHAVSASHANAYRCPHAACTEEIRHFTKHGLHKHAKKAHKTRYNIADLEPAYLSCPWYKCKREKMKAGSFMRHILTHSRVTFQCPVCDYRNSRWSDFDRHFVDKHPEERERYGQTVYVERRQEDFRYNWPERG